MAVIITAVLAVDRAVHLSSGLLWGLSLWGALHLFGGTVTLPEGWLASGPERVFYNLWIIPERLKYDQVVHAFGFGMTTWLCWQALRSALVKRCGSPGAVQLSWGLAILCIAAGMGFGALNEVLEFAATLTVPNTNVGGYENTAWDLVSNLVGSVLAMTVIACHERRRHS